MSNDSQQIMLPKWAATALVIAAGICLIESLWLAFHDKAAAGTLTAGLFVVCVLFIYLPRMQSFKAWGVEVAWQAVKEREAALTKATMELETKISANAPKEELAATIGKVRTAITQLSTANNELSATLTTIRPFRATRGSN